MLVSAERLAQVAQALRAAWRITRAGQPIGYMVGQPMTYSERVAIGEAIEAELQGRHGGDRTETKPENFPACPQGDTRDLAAKAAGFGNGKTYEQAKKVANAELEDKS